MAIVESLRALGITVEDPRSVAEGLGKLIITLAQKKSLLKEYLTERGLDPSPELEALLGD